MRNPPLRISVGLFCIQRLLNGDFGRVLGLASMLDRKGVDQISISDHVAISGDGLAKYHNRFPMGIDEPWYEPIAVLSAVAAVTLRMRLSTSVLIGPLRSAVLLAKQVATLDVLSRGRVDIGLGVGWQREEYDASGLSFEGRFRYLEEEVAACRQLWSGSPESFHGRHISFDNLIALPRPVQPSVPIWLGLSPSPRNIARIARIADGWVANIVDPDQIAAAIAAIRQAMTAEGRDPDRLEVRAALAPARRSDGSVDLDASFAAAPRLRAAGVTVIEVSPFFFCRNGDDIDALVDRAVALKD
jgi:probable F420-dependent oxidoreductase